eukprot:13787126-Alexandrium_andersonii.AAC.1
MPERRRGAAKQSGRKRAAAQAAADSARRRPRRRASAATPSRERACLGKASIWAERDSAARGADGEAGTNAACQSCPA